MTRLASEPAGAFAVTVVGEDGDVPQGNTAYPGGTPGVVRGCGSCFGRVDTEPHKWRVLVLRLLFGRILLVLRTLHWKLAAGRTRMAIPSTGRIASVDAGAPYRGSGPLPSALDEPPTG